MNTDVDKELHELMDGLSARAKMRLRHALLGRYLRLKGILSLRRLGLLEGPEGAGQSEGGATWQI
jgi:hypothetical protein